MNGSPCLKTTTDGQRVTVEIPDELPALMMDVAREVIRYAPEDEYTAYSIVADYLEKIIKEKNAKEVTCIDNEWTPEMITQNVIETVEEYGVTPESANYAAILIQRAWRKYIKSVTNIQNNSIETGDHVFSKEIRIDTYEEINYENDSDDMERVNVVRKGQRDYVPPIPDFIDDLYSGKYEENLIGQPKEISYEDEEYSYKSLKSIDNQWSQNMIKADEKLDVTPKFVKDAVSSIQPVPLEMGDRISTKKIQIDTYEEMNYENDSDDMELVNVVRKGQRDYVPPIPDFINDVYSLKDEENVNGQPNESSYEDE